MRYESLPVSDRENYVKTLENHIRNAASNFEKNPRVEEARNTNVRLIDPSTYKPNRK